MQICLNDNAEQSQLSTTCCISSLKGSRSYMEDEYTVVKTQGLTVYAVFDGHGGGEIAALLKRKFIPYLIDCVSPTLYTGHLSSDRQIKQSISEAFVNFDRQIYTEYSSIYHQGATATVCLKIDSLFGTRIYIAHVGDSRVLAFSSDKRIIYQSRDHRPADPDEYKRVTSKGALIMSSRVNGVLALTRAFGDFNEGIKLRHGKFDASKAAVTAQPDVALISLTKLPFYLVVASDGLWDVFNADETINVCLRNNDIHTSCETLVNEAIYQRYSSDNVTAMVIRIDKG